MLCRHARKYTVCCMRKRESRILGQPPRGTGLNIWQPSPVEVFVVPILSPSLFPKAWHIMCYHWKKCQPVIPFLLLFTPQAWAELPQYPTVLLSCHLLCGQSAARHSFLGAGGKLIKYFNVKKLYGFRDVKSVQGIAFTGFLLDHDPNIPYRFCGRFWVSGVRAPWDLNVAWVSGPFDWQQ